MISPPITRVGAPNRPRASAASVAPDQRGAASIVIGTRLDAVRIDAE